jgi:AcrR family transcriptional regulator
MSVQTDTSVQVTKRRGEARQEHILDCALEVFGSKGFHTASIADICTRAGIARGTLYQYFRDKRDVLVALFNRIVQRVVDQVGAWPQYDPPPGPPDEAFALALIEGRCRAILDAVFQDEATARLVLRVARSVDGIVEEAMRRLDAEVVRAVERDLRVAIAAGRIRECDPTLIARLAVGGMGHVVLAALDDHEAVDKDHIAREAARVLTLGLLWRTAPADPPAPAAHEPDPTPPDSGGSTR